MASHGKLRLAVSQSATLPTTAETLKQLHATANRAAAAAIDLLLFPEAYLGGYPRGATFGTTVGTRDESGREQFLRYFKDAVDLGDSPTGEGERWVHREWAGEKTDEITLRGDGMREALEKIASETGVFLVVGLVERAGGTLYCSVVYVCPRRGMIGKRRKVMPTGCERLIWGLGQPSSLRAVTTTIRGVKLTLAAAVCWESYMPLLRHSLYSQNVNLYLAPTADARDTWLPLMRTVACEGRCFVLSANQCTRKMDLPEWIHGDTTEEDTPEGYHRMGIRYRRRSIVTESGHEIALSADSWKDGSEVAVSGDEENSDERKSSDTAHGRKYSVITASGHQIALPAGNEKKAPSQSGDMAEESLYSRKNVRKASFMTEDGHEIVLPPDEAKKESENATNGERPVLNGKSRERKSSFWTDDGHEIVFPRDKGRVEKTMNGHGSKRSGMAETKAGPSEYACRGGSCIISPSGEVLAGPSWEKQDDLLIVDVDFDDCLRGRLDLDVAGSYSRNDAFKLTVEGLDLSPPP